MKKKILFLLNPISGTVKKARIPQLIEKYLDTERFDAEIKYTEYAGHATVLAHEASERGVDVVVAVGGDGTINEVGRALVHTSTAMGILPCGSGNGLARHLRLPMNLKRAIEVLNLCDIRDLDYGLINGHPFFCTCGMGFDAHISSIFASGGKRGKIRYVKLVLQQGLKYPPQDYVVEDEQGRHEYHAYLVSCANASQYGNNAYIAPQALMSDGVLDAIIMDPFDALDAPQMSFDMMNKVLHKSVKVKTYHTKKMHVTRQKPGPVHFDGDPMEMGKEIDIEIREKGIKILVNPVIDQHPLRANRLQNVMCKVFNTLSEKRMKNKKTESIDSSEDN